MMKVFVVFFSSAFILLLPVNAQLGRTCRGNSDCKNGGTCNVAGRCLCSPGWGGRFCQISACTEACPDGLVCVEGNICQPKSPDSSCSPSWCKNGICRDQLCECDDGFTGADCSTPVCPGGCGSHGQCTSPEKCTCESGWTGNDCTIRASVTCDGGCDNGRCVGTNRCQCSPGYQGAKCSDPICDNDCGDHGLCTDPGKCLCLSDYTGSDCLTPPNPCPSGCGDHGTCAGSNTCQCQLGYSGDSCDVKTGKPLGDTCTGDFECSRTVPSSVCQKPALSCSIGRCSCPKGYTQIDGRCLVGKGYGEPCNRPDFSCTGDNVYCSEKDGICACKYGFVEGPLDDPPCVKSSAKSKLGETCKSSDECFYDLTCYRNVCSCPRGRFAPPGSSYKCEVINYGDSCTGNRDCTHLARAQCISGKCQCKFGYIMTPYLTEKGERKLTCANNLVAKQDNVCLRNLESICEDNFACITCPGDANVSPRCLWPSAIPLPTRTPQLTPAPLVVTKKPIVSSSVSFSASIGVLLFAALIGLLL